MVAQTLFGNIKIFLQLTSLSAFGLVLEKHTCVFICFLIQHAGSCSGSRLEPTSLIQAHVTAQSQNELRKHVL